jgi:hypothetical protein
MILGFKTLNPVTNKATGFVRKILCNEKKHTIRRGNRWKKGKIIHMATGVRTAHYKQFNKYRKDLQKCLHVQEIRLISSTREIFIDGRRLPLERQNTFAKNDGFDSLEDFWQ